MATVILDIPDERLDQLEKRAEAEGMSVSEYLLRDTEPTAVGPISDELWEHLKSLPRVDFGMSGADAVREAREERDRQIDEWLRSR